MDHAFLPEPTRRGARLRPNRFAILAIALIASALLGQARARACTGSGRGQRRGGGEARAGAPGNAPRDKEGVLELRLRRRSRVRRSCRRTAGCSTTRSGLGSKIRVVLYPRGQKWATAPTVMYSNPLHQDRLAPQDVSRR